MPELRELEKFEKFLFRFSGEPEWRAQKGEPVDSVNSLVDDASNLEDGRDSKVAVGDDEVLKKYGDNSEGDLGVITSDQSDNREFISTGRKEGAQDFDSITTDRVGDKQSALENSEDGFDGFEETAKEMVDDIQQTVDEQVVGSSLGSDVDKDDLDLDDLPDLDDLSDLDNLPDLDDLPSYNKTEFGNQDRFKDLGSGNVVESVSSKTSEKIPDFLDEDAFFESDNEEYRGEEGVQEFDFGTDSISFKDSDVEKVEDFLESCPRNLRIAVEEILSSMETSDTTIKMFVDKIVSGVSLRSIVDDVRVVTGRTIVIPLSYQRGTVKDLERRKHAFTYLFKTKAWPVLKRIFLVSIFICSFILVFFHFFYRPIVANHYYRQGYKKISAGKYDGVEDSFSKAFEGWKVGFLNVKGVRKQNWFYKYADSYIQQRQIGRTIEKYEQLLHYYPNSKKAHLKYAFFEKNFSAHYKAADQILTRYLTNIDPFNVDVLLEKGDNLFAWGDFVPAKTEEARRVYADLQYKMGRITSRLGMRFLRYAVRVDNRNEIERWANYFMARLEGKGKVQIDPLAFSELAGWYLDNNQVGFARKILDSAIRAHPSHADVLYQMARYYSDGGISNVQEERMLQRTYYELSRKGELTWRETGILIDIYRRFGLLYTQRNEGLKAEEYFLEAVQTYEGAVRAKILIPKEEYGRIYKEFGDLYYTRGKDYFSAMLYMNKALDNFYDTPDLRYKLGYAYSSQEKYQDSLLHFYLSFENAQDNVNVLFSYATTLAKVGNYAVSEGVYEHLILELELLNQGQDGNNIMTPDRRRRVINFLHKAYNNLGVVRYQLSRSSSEKVRYRILSELNLGKSVVYWDQLTRSSETKERNMGQGLPQVNFRATMHPSSEPDLRLFDELPRDFFD